MWSRNSWIIAGFAAAAESACIELGALRDETPDADSPSAGPNSEIEADVSLEPSSAAGLAPVAFQDSSSDGGTSLSEAPRDTVSFDQAEVGHRHIDANGYHTCVIVQGGRVVCWGNNAYGQLGDGSEVPAKPALPVEVRSLGGAVDVSAGLYHTCALLEDGSVWCWGDDSAGQLGDGAPHLPSSTPVSVLGIERAVDLDAGDHFSCAVIEDGRVRCWGHDAEGQLGESVIPVDTHRLAGDVEGIRDAVTVSAGSKHACALLRSGALRCWGENVWGQLGDGRENEAVRSVPEDVVGLEQVAAVAAGAHNTCAILPDRTLWCWGFDEWGTLGDGDPTRNTISYVPLQVNGLQGVVEVGVGSLHACALEENGEIQCWGSDQYGQVGDKTNTDFVKESPGDVEVSFAATQLAMGSWHSCARSTSGEVACWGSNEHGQVGIGSVVPEIVALPTKVEGL